MHDLEADLTTVSSQTQSKNRTLLTRKAIIITDVGIGRRSDAFFWLILGHHVYDYKFREMGISELEHEIDPEDKIDPILVRGTLWKTVPPRLWQAEGSGPYGPVPSQPGMDVLMSYNYNCHHQEGKGRVPRTLLTVPMETEMLLAEAGSWVPCDSFPRSKSATPSLKQSDQIIKQHQRARSRSFDQGLAAQEEGSSLQSALQYACEESPSDSAILYCGEKEDFPTQPAKHKRPQRRWDSLLDSDSSSNSSDDVNGDLPTLTISQAHVMIYI